MVLTLVKYQYESMLMQINLTLIREQSGENGDSLFINVICVYC